MIEKLLAYQNADAKLRKIETQLSGSEERKKAVSAKKFLETSPENVNKLDARARDLEAEFKNTLAEISKFNEQQAELDAAMKAAEDETEVAYLIKKADELSSNVKFLEGKISKLIEEIQAIVKEFNAVKAQIKVAQAQYAEFGKKYNELKASVQGDKEAVEKELNELKKEVPSDLMERYAKKRANKIYPIVYEVSGNHCGACGMELSMADVGKLKKGDVIDCEQCGRMLYQGK